MSQNNALVKDSKYKKKTEGRQMHKTHTHAQWISEWMHAYKV